MHRNKLYLYIVIVTTAARCPAAHVASLLMRRPSGDDSVNYHLIHLTSLFIFEKYHSNGAAVAQEVGADVWFDPRAPSS